MKNDRNKRVFDYLSEVAPSVANRFLKLPPEQKAIAAAQIEDRVTRCKNLGVMPEQGLFSEIVNDAAQGISVLPDNDTQFSRPPLSVRG